MEIKPFWVEVTPEQSKIVQETLFKNGYTWHGGRTEISHTDSRYLSFYGTEELPFISPNLTYGGNRAEAYTPKLTFEEFKQKYIMNTQDKIKQLEVELNKLKEEVKKETEFKVGDWVTTISKAEECYYKWKIGEIFQITRIDIQGGAVYFNSHNSVEIERVRKATQSEITKATSKSKELYFGDTKVTIKQGSSYAETQYGNISKVEIKEIIDFFNQDITLLGHKMSIKNSSTWYIAFGCQQGTLAQIKEIYKAFD